ncbi:MAG: pyridoxal-phosphate dependent enzyme [Candidatus Lokiarchaeota archaeon]|nr:pyridoxal-phosphate dependent enzyme [Candidatus Lokiarchaeota archaeon]
MAKFRVTCSACTRVLPESSPAMKCHSCGGQLGVHVDLDPLKERCNSPASFAAFQGPIPRSMWKYFDFLPLVDFRHVISLGEGSTPLLGSKHLGPSIGMASVTFKVETGNPTGSFKDRQVSIGISRAAELGAKGVITVSSGNVGAAVSAYSSRAGLPAIVLVPEMSPANKVTQVQAYGARVFQVKTDSTSGILDAVAPACARHGFANLMTASQVNPYINHGAKTIAYEIVHDRIVAGLEPAPDVIVTPAGGGGLLSHVYQGFLDLVELDVIDRVPRFIAVQPTGCPPLARAILDETPIEAVYKQPWKNIKTIATALADDVPLDARLAIPAVKHTGGTACIVDDAEILEAEKKLARFEGIFAEPSSATTAAALEKVAMIGAVDKTEHVVLLVTGSGFKDMDAVRRINPELPVVPADHDWDAEFTRIRKIGNK